MQSRSGAQSGMEFGHYNDLFFSSSYNDIWQGISLSREHSNEDSATTGVVGISPIVSYGLSWGEGEFSMEMVFSGEGYHLEIVEGRRNDIDICHLLSDENSFEGWSTDLREHEITTLDELAISILDFANLPL